MKEDKDNLDILRNITNSNKIRQRQLASKLGFSLGKLNYCLKSLKKKKVSSRLEILAKIKINLIHILKQIIYIF